MDIHYTVRTGNVLPYIESFRVTRQTEACPPGVIQVLQHKILADISKNPHLREFTFAPKHSCAIHVTIDIVQDHPILPSV